MMPTLRTVKLSSVVFDETIYPQDTHHDPLLVEKYAENMAYLLNHEPEQHDQASIERYAAHLDSWFLSHEIALFSRPLGRIVFVLRDGSYYWRDDLGRQILEAWRLLAVYEASEGRLFQTESAFVVCICEAMEPDGWLCRREVHTRLGRIDLLASKGEAIRLIEAKLSLGTNSMSHALGQLLFGKASYPTATLWIACPLQPSLPIMQCLNAYGVSYLEGPWSK